VKWVEKFFILNHVKLSEILKLNPFFVVVIVPLVNSYKSIFVLLLALILQSIFVLFLVHGSVDDLGR
jgi:uncharacterized membrane protein